MKTLLVILASVLLLTSVMSVALAETQQTVQASATVTGVLSLTANSTSLNFEDLAEESTGDAAVELTVDSNVNYDLFGEVASSEFTSTGDGTLATSHLKWSLDDVSYSTYAVSPSSTTMKSGESGDNSYTVYNELSIPAGTLADEYTVGVTYKVS